LPVVNHGDSNLRDHGALRAAHVAGNSDPFAGLFVEGDERLVVVVVHIGQITHRFLVELGRWRQESAIAGLGAQPLEATQQQFLVGAADLTQPDL
jgi:hypothetical protein